jgi:CRISPR-associated protein Csm5
MKVRLTTLTPLHVGGREGVLSPLEFVFFKDCCYVISEEKLATALQKAGKTDLFLGWFSSFREGDRQKPSLFGFLREQTLLNARFLEQICTYAVPTSIRVGNNLRPFIRNGFNRPFLPGSTVKGPIRTAFLYKALKDLSPDQREEFLDDPVIDHLNEYDRDPRRRNPGFRESFKQGFSHGLDANFFQRFVLREGDEYDPHTDIFRCLRITDSVPLSPDATQVEEIKVYSAPSDNPKNYSIYAECLPPGSKVEWELSVDEMLLAKFRTQNRQTWFGADFAILEEMLHKPLKVWAEMGQDLWQEETQFFAKEFGFSDVIPENKGRPLVHLGWGGGLLGTSVDMLLPGPLRQRLRDTLFDDRKNTPAPKSRRLIENSNERIPLGWATVEQVK